MPTAAPTNSTDIEVFEELLFPLFDVVAALAFVVADVDDTAVLVVFVVLNALSMHPVAEHVQPGGHVLVGFL